MHVQLVARQPSSHHLFRRSPEVPPGRVHFRTHTNTDRHIERFGPAYQAHQVWGKVGMLCGVLESLTDTSLEGSVSVTISRGSYEMTGTLLIYNLAVERIVLATLDAAEQVAHGLTLDPQLMNATVTYTQEIVEIKGN